MNRQLQIEELLTIPDVARILVCSEANVYALIARPRPSETAREPVRRESETTLRNHTSKEQAEKRTYASKVLP